MRRKDRELNKIDELSDILHNGSIAQIAFIDDGRPYIVTMNFGFSIDGHKIKLFFHSAPEGRKIKCIKNNPEVCFTVAIPDPLIEGESACQYSMKYRSIVGYGKIKILEDQSAKIIALNKIMHHYTGLDKWEYEKTVIKNTTLFCLEVESITGKRKS